jgi:hypothetical protein
MQTIQPSALSDLDPIGNERGKQRLVRPEARLRRDAKDPARQSIPQIDLSTISRHGAAGHLGALWRQSVATWRS